MDMTKLQAPTGDDKISRGTLGYITARNRHTMHDIVIREFKDSGITQATLALRLEVLPEVISLLLTGGPYYWEEDTFCKLLFAISGGVPTYDIWYPLRPD